MKTQAFALARNRWFQLWTALCLAVVGAVNISAGALTLAFRTDPFFMALAGLITTGVWLIIAATRKSKSACALASLCAYAACIVYSNLYNAAIQHLTKDQEQWLIAIGIAVLLVSARPLLRTIRISDALSTILLTVGFAFFAGGLIFTTYDWAIQLNRYELLMLCNIGAFLLFGAAIVFAVLFVWAVMRINLIDNPPVSMWRPFPAKVVRRLIFMLICVIPALALTELARWLGGLAP